MATAPISLLQLTNASLDADDLDVVVNGGENATTVNRVGNTLPSISKWLADAASELDVVLSVGGIYETVEDGLAATDDGGYFVVQSDRADSFADRYQKVGANAVYTGASVPTGRALEDARVTSGELFGDVFPSGALAAGAVYVVDSLGRNVGFTIPAGQTGSGSFLAFFYPLSVQEKALLVGTTQRFRLVMETTPDYLENVALSGAVMLVRRGGAYPAVGSFVGRWQDGNYLYQDVDYTVTAEDDEIGVAMQIGTQAALAAAYTFSGVSLSYRAVAGVVGEATTGADRSLDAALLNVNRDDEVSFVRVLDEAIIGTSVQNGATVITVDGRGMGFSIPPGSNGDGTITQAQISVDMTSDPVFAGRQVRFAVWATTSAVFTRQIRLFMQRIFNGGNAITEIAVDRTVRSSATKLYIEGRYTVVGDEIGLWPFARSSGVSAVGTTETFVVDDMQLIFVGERDESLTAAALNALMSQRRLAAAVESKVGESIPTRVELFPTAGVMPSLIDAQNALVSPSFSNQYDLELNGGKQRQSDNSFPLRDYVNIVGSFRNSAILDAGVMPVTIPPADTFTSQSVYANRSHTFRGVTILAENARYPLHADSANADKNGVLRLEYSELIHYGNDGARAYQTSIGGNPGGVWANEQAIGSGISDGSKILAVGTLFQAPQCGVLVHTWGMFEKPAEVHLKFCPIVSTRDGTAIEIQPLGSFTQDVLTLDANLVEGEISVRPAPWLADGTIATQCGNHMEWKIIGSGNHGYHPFRVFEDGRVLKIQSAATSGTSTVDISGTAVPVLFGTGQYGPAVVTKDGAGGLAGYVYGWNDVSGLVKPNNVATSMESRMGNATGGNAKTLSVSVNGGAVININFNADYSASPAGTILGIINAALGASATASLYNEGGRFRPQLLDEERRLENSSTVGILMGSICAYDNDIRRTRLMTSTDPVSLYAGVALEDIYPGQFGRVKTGGYLLLDSEVPDILRTDSAAVVFGDTFSVTAGSPGQVSKGGSQGLLRAVRTNAVQVKLG